MQLESWIESEFQPQKGQMAFSVFAQGAELGLEFAKTQTYLRMHMAKNRTTLFTYESAS